MPDILKIILPIAIVAAVLLLFFLGYLKAPPDTAYIISGLGRKRILIGKAGWRVPFFERVDKLSLRIMQVDVKTSEAVPTNEFINVTVDGVANVKISSDPELLKLAAEALLGKRPEELVGLVTQVLEGNMREIVGSVGLKEMVQDRQGVARKITENVVPDMRKLGLEVVNFNIQNFKDGAGTIENMGIDNVEQIRKNAQIAKANAQRDIAIATSQAQQEANAVKVQAEKMIAEQDAALAIQQADGPGGVPLRQPRRVEVGMKKPSMSFPTAFTLSLNNLMTKKGRTLLTSFAGSIGIIGIALILSLSAGINSYIDQVQEETLSSYPITIQAESTDMSDLLTSLMGAHRGEKGEDHDMERVYSSTVMYDMLNSMVEAEVQTNNLRDFKKYLDQGGGGISDLATIQYSYDFAFDIYTRDEDGKIVKSDVMTMLEQAMTAMYGGDYSSYFANMGAMYERMDVWEELLPGNDGAAVGEQVKSQYDLLYGKWPERYDEVILFVDRNNEISDLMLYALGLLSSDHMTESLNSAMEGQTLEAQQRSWSYEELCGMDFKQIGRAHV